MTAGPARSAHFSTLTHEDQTLLLAACQRQWKRVRARFSKVSLPSQEWEDIQSLATIRVFQKAAESYDPSRGSLDTWAATVMRRVAQNEFRRMFVNRKAMDKMGQRAKMNLFTARSLRVKVIGIGHWGEQTVVIEPDILDPASMENKPDWADFSLTLSRQEQRHLTLLLEGKGFIALAAKPVTFEGRSMDRHKRNAYAYASADGRKRVKALAAKYLDYLNHRITVV